MTKSILIIGGGIGGLVAALALSQDDHKVTICEQAETFGEIGAGIQLSSNAMHVLRKLGLEAKIAQIAVTPNAAILKDYRNGTPLLSTPLGREHQQRYGAPYLHVHRADLHEVLAKAVQQAGVECHMNKMLTRVVEEATHVTAHFNDNTHLKADCLIGADGIHSVVRTTLSKASPPRFKGQVAWRGLVPADALPSGMLSKDAHAWLGPNRHFVAYYVRGGTLINFIAVEERDLWQEESWSTKGDLTLLRQAFAGWDQPVQAILSSCHGCYCWGLHDHPPLPKWTSPRIALLGDASHSMLPFMAQGAAMAIEDAWVLHQKLKDTSLTLEQALTDYENIRKPRTSMLQNISTQNADLFHMTNPALVMKRRASFKIAQMVPALRNQRLDRIYGMNVTKQDD